MGKTPLLPAPQIFLPHACTFLDVGGNNGMTSTTWLKLWRPGTNLSPYKLGMKYIAPYRKARNDTSAPCSVCGCCCEVGALWKNC